MSRKHPFHSFNVLFLLEPCKDIQIILRFDQRPARSQSISPTVPGTPDPPQSEESYLHRCGSEYNSLRLFYLPLLLPVVHDCIDEQSRFRQRQGRYVLELPQPQICRSFFIALGLLARA